MQCPARYADRTVRGRKTREHVLVAERALGKRLPIGAVVHHVDQDRSNNTPTNLVICQDRAYHNLLHARMRALAAVGWPGAKPCRYCKRYDDPSNMSTIRRLSGERVGQELTYHVACATRQNAEWRARRAS